MQTPIKQLIEVLKTIVEGTTNEEPGALQYELCVEEASGDIVVIEK
jgi:quinol monooxygenase YgiN